jgi:hypothetical protein
MKSDARQSAARRFWRTIIVTSLAAFVLGTTQPNVLAAIYGISNGTYGMAVDYQAVVTQVVPGLPAARASIAPGDKIKPDSFSDRMYLFESEITQPGTVVHAVVQRGTNQRSVTLTSVAGSETTAIVVTIIKRLTALAFILVGAGLVLLRPSRMTWGLFLFALSSNGIAGALYFHIFGLGVYTPIEFALSTIYSLGPLGLWIFAARFPNDDAPGWRAIFDKAAPWLAIPLLATTLPLWSALVLGSEITPAWHWFAQYFPVVVETIGILILIANYVQERGEAHQRIKWVVAGFAVGYISDGAVTLLGDPHVHLWPIAWQPEFTPDILYGLWIVTPVAIAYAVLRHRVIDVRFAVSRAIVYAVLTSLVVAAFAFIDWIFTKKMSAAGLGTVAEIGVAIAIGFWFNTLHKRIDSFVDGALFRRRHLAEKRLALAASALPHAASLPAAAELLTAEPVHAFELTSGASFMRSDDESFKRIFAIGWGEPSATELPNDDLLIARLRATREALSLHGLYWPAAQRCPEGAAAPVLAMPVFIRTQLAAIVLFGPHASGETFDPDELRSLNAICVGASAAFDHLEAELRRAENESLRKIIEQFGGRASTPVPGVATA